MYLTNALVAGQLIIRALWAACKLLLNLRRRAFKRVQNPYDPAAIVPAQLSSAQLSSAQPSPAQPGPVGIVTTAGVRSGGYRPSSNLMR
jgi:hypothetical protein